MTTPVAVFQSVYTNTYTAGTGIGPGAVRADHRWGGAKPLYRFRNGHPKQGHVERSDIVEGDLIIGKAHESAIITVFDRASRHLWMAGLPDSHAATQH